jgi:hypothetical protein
MHKRANIRFYAKADARDILSPAWQRYADHANYVQHRVLVGRALWSVDDATNRYTLLKSEYLRNIVGRHRLGPLLVEMQRSGLIERDVYWTKGEKSFGYRIGDKFDSNETVRIECRNRRLRDKILTIRLQDFRHYTKVHRHLFDWLRKVELDFGTALRIINQTRYDDGKLSRQEWRDLNVLAARIICDKEFELTTCHYGRVHTNVTRLIRPVRRELRIASTPLVEIDIANSQPLFLTACVLAGIPATFTNSCFHSYSPTVTPVISSTNHISYPHTSYVMDTFSASDCSVNGLRSYSRTYSTTPSDLMEFQARCERGQVYEHLMQRMNWIEGRDRFKDEEVFRILYGANTSYNSQGEFQPSKLQPILESDFPTVWAFIRNYKRQHGYRELSREMQRQESKLMIEGVCGRLMNEFPDCPLVTVHDSILTTEPWVETVAGTIKDEFGRKGLQPTLHIR